MTTVEIKTFDNITRCQKIIEKIPRPATLLDLGCGHGKYSIMARNLGFDVTAMDARPDRIPFHEEKIKWIVKDVSDFDFSYYDVVLFLGLLYHLPFAVQMDILMKLQCRLLVIDTHYCLPEWENLCFIGGFYGCNYHEADTIGELKARSRAAFSNTDSFLPSPETLEKMVFGAGFSSFAKVLPIAKKNRTFFIAVK
jgi:SAM-dependent methyltransferase